MNRLDEPVFMAMSKPLLTEFGIHHGLESCVNQDRHKTWDLNTSFFKARQYVAYHNVLQIRVRLPDDIPTSYSSLDPTQRVVRHWKLLGW